MHTTSRDHSWGVCWPFDEAGEDTALKWASLKDRLDIVKMILENDKVDANLRISQVQQLVMLPRLVKCLKLRSVWRTTNYLRRF